MEKIYIIGSVGSGKTTLAKRLSSSLKIPYYELDNIVYKNKGQNRKRASIESQLDEIQKIDSRGLWIFEGVYRKSYHCLYERCDKIIFLDTPYRRRKINIIVRFIKQQLGLEECSYKSDLKMLYLMLKWNREFEKTRHIFERRLVLYTDKVVHIKSSKELKL